MIDHRRQLLAPGLRARVAAGAALVGLYLVGLVVAFGGGSLLAGVGVAALVLAAAIFGPRALLAARDPLVRVAMKRRLRAAAGRVGAAVAGSGRAACSGSARATSALAVMTVRRVIPAVRGAAAAAARAARAGSSRLGGIDAAATVVAAGPTRLAPLLRTLEIAAGVGVQAAARIARRGLEQASLRLSAVPTPEVEREPTGLRRSESLREALELNRLGSAARREGRRDDAVDAHTRALELVREFGDRRHEALTLSNLALALADRDSDAAVARCEQALAILHELGETQAEGQVIANIATLHKRAGRTNEAIAYWQSALDRFHPGSAEHARIAENLRIAS